MMRGERVHLNESKELRFSTPGQYGQDRDGRWLCAIPVRVEEAIGGLVIGNLGSHEVTEHEDGTITVSPSILVEHWARTWHGYLERGVWREV